MAHIEIEGRIYQVDTDEERIAARAALREADMFWAPVVVGEPGARLTPLTDREAAALLRPHIEEAADRDAVRFVEEFGQQYDPDADADANAWAREKFQYAPAPSGELDSWSAGLGLAAWAWDLYERRLSATTCALTPYAD